VCLAAALYAESAGQLFKKGRKAERSGDIVQAYLLYSQAAALDPGNRKYWAHSYALRTKAAMHANVMPPSAAFTVPAVDAKSEAGATEDEAPGGTLEQVDGEDGPAPLQPQVDSTITDEDLRDLKRLRPPPELQPSDSKQSFDLREDSKTLFEHVARAYGLAVVFDGEYTPSSQPIRFRITDAGFREAIHALEAVTSSFITSVNERMFLVARDTQQKRNEVEPTVAIVFPIPQTTTPQETQELARAIQQVMELQKFAVDSTRRLVMIRDRISKVRPAQMIFEQMLWDKAEVAIEMEFLEVSRNSSLDYGLRLPTSFPLVNFGNAVPSIPAGFTKFLAFGGGRTLFGIGLTDAELFASMSRAATNTLLKTTIRSLEGQAATFHVGDRYPVLTAGYFGEVTNQGQVFTPPPSFQFEDLGVVLKVTPRVHGMEEITLEVEAEFKVLSGGSVNGIPIISTRKFQSAIRLKNGEWAVMSGLLSTVEARAISGIAGLASLPYLGALFRTNTKSESEGQTLILFKPRLVNLPTSEAVTRTLWTGAETRPLTPL
jgi:hypothetical protein